MSNRTVLVSGAGIAGPALAFWLTRHGFRPTVVERAPAPRTGGQAVDIRGSAREVVHRMGLLDAVRACHTGTVGLMAVDARGKPLWRWGAALSGDSGGIIAELEILRTDLSRLLLEATGDVEYVYGDAISRLEQGESGVRVAFESGAQRVFDLVVGADGLHSRVRRLAFETTFEDRGYFKAVFSAPPRPELEGWQLSYSLPGRRRAMIYPTRQGPSRGMLFFAAPPDAVPRDVAMQKRALEERFAGAGWEIDGLLAAMREAPDFYFDRECVVHVDRWSNGRVVLLGDAAFAGSVGMGTSMALVGAYVLAQELARSNHPDAFAAYEARLRPWVTEQQKPMPGGTNAFLPDGRFGIWLGNQGMRAMLAGPWRSALTGGLHESAHAVALG